MIQGTNAKPLRELFLTNLKDKGPTERARTIVEKLQGVITNLDTLHITNPSARELVEFDMEVVKQAVETIAVLETEQFRQREAIKLYLHGRITREELRRYSETWNGDKA